MRTGHASPLSVVALTIAAIALLTPIISARSLEPTLYETVDSTEHSNHILDGLGDAEERVWRRGDTLWIAKRGSKKPWRTIGDLSHTLERVGDTGVWAIGLTWDSWAHAFVRVGFLSDDEPSTTPEYITWRGEHAPCATIESEPGLIETLELPGPIPGETRSVTVVLPKGTHPDAPLPTIVLADGQSAERWGRVLATLIDQGAIRPVAVVGVHSGGYQGDRSEPYDASKDTRAREYLEGFDPDRFDAHLSWVIDSVLPKIAEQYPISLEREDLTIAGFSNGGSFAAAAALRRGDVFGTCLALSIGITPELGDADPSANPTTFFLAAGELEPGFLQGTSDMRDALKGAGFDATMTSFISGHNPEMWVLALARYAPVLFPMD